MKISVQNLFFLCCIFVLSYEQRLLETGFYCDGEILDITAPTNTLILIYEIYHQSICSSTLDNTVPGIIKSDPPAELADCHLNRSCRAIISSKPNTSLSLKYLFIPDRILPSGSDDAFSICGTKELRRITNGFIHTPNYPKVYPNRMDCRLKIEVPPKHKIIITAYDMDVEGMSHFLFWKSRPNDYLEINNASLFYKPIQRPSIIHISFETVELHFKSDFANTLRNYRGFNLHFAIIPENEFIWTTQPVVTKFTPFHMAYKYVPIQKSESYTKKILLIFIPSLCAFVALISLLMYKRHRRLLKYMEVLFKNSSDEIPDYTLITNNEISPKSNHAAPPGSNHDALEGKSVLEGNYYTDEPKTNREQSYDYVETLEEPPPTYEYINTKIEEEKKLEQNAK